MGREVGISHGLLRDIDIDLKEEPYKYNQKRP